MKDLVQRFKVGEKQCGAAIVGEVGKRFDTTDHILLWNKGDEWHLTPKQARELSLVLSIVVDEAERDDKQEAAYLSLGLTN
jgi:hypothetical protein